MRSVFITCSWILIALAVAGAELVKFQNLPSYNELFESRVRPILVDHCYACHSAKSAQLKGGFCLDSRSALLKGGARGPAIIPGNPGKSILLHAIAYEDPSLQMPPRGKLPARAISDLTEWVKQGAPWPTSTANVAIQSSPNQNSSIVNLPLSIMHRPTTDFWSFKPLSKSPIPAVKNKSWPRNPIDNFILSNLDSNGLKPAPPAEQSVWLRRVTFDLIGLPPTPAELDAFLKDNSANAYEKVVERLLASPHYGERWARHWLDLVRYAETDGHEFDTDKPGAYEYRDYVIRALNSDVPYNQFAKEHVAGDLLPSPRRHPTEGFNESIIGTGFWWLGEADHSPVDVRENECERFANQIDVFSKAFLGLSAGCARCHDHKFDPIPTKDYYALAGYLRSSRFNLADISPTDSRKSLVRGLEEINTKEQPILRRLFAERLNVLFESSQTIKGAAEAPRPEDEFVDFSRTGFADWFVTGEAFGSFPTQSASVRRSMSGDSLFLARPGFADSGAISNALPGTLRSRTFIISKPQVNYLLAGRDTQLNLIVDGYQKIRDPIYGGLTIRPDADAPKWYSQDVSKWIGHHAYIELIDNGPGWIALQRASFSNAGAALPENRAASPTMPPESFAASADLLALDAKRIAIIAQLQRPRRVLAMADGTGEDENVFIRGNFKTLGDLAPRRFLSACGGAEQPVSGSGSGRLELAVRMVSTSNPLLARVIVNRVWQHHFGEGIVRSTDDFGFMGQRPSHPKLLDWLAVSFMKGDARRLTTDGNNGDALSIVPRPSSGSAPWSLKSLHRLIVLSSTYRMSSRPDPLVDKLDPQNRLLHRSNIRRIEAECVRDAILAVSGRLDEKMFGPSVMPHLTPFMEGRGRPDTSGPLDGNGRRSIYISVRRNFLTPMFLAFDHPVPFTCMGHRAVSNVPSQALALMNNPFVTQQASVWAQKLLSEPNLTVEQRINRLYNRAFARPATNTDLQSAITFLSEQDRGYRASNDLRSWADLCHVLYNVKEFIFIN
jgi:hypothetical protein